MFEAQGTTRPGRPWHLWSIGIIGGLGGATVFDFGEFSSEMASRKNPDGTISFITIVPGFKSTRP